MSLLALQRDFRRHLVNAPTDMRLWAGEGAVPGLAVYHNAYRVQLSDCLAETFPQTHAWLGGEAFIHAARTHIESSPPSGWTLGVYGDTFDRALAVLYPDDPEVAELARLEWLLSRAFEDRDVAAMPADAIAAIDWDHAALRFVPTRVSPVRTNAGGLWSALAAGARPPLPAMLPAPAMMLVWRQDFTPCFRTIELIEHGAIALMQAGTGFAALCDMLVDARGADAGVALAGAMLGQWFSDGLIAEMTITA